MKNENVKLVLFTPEMAKEIISKPSTNYRASKEKVVNQYAKDMKNGKWFFCGDSIKFDKDGNCIDGQHRLKAIIESEKSQMFIRVDGLEPESAQVMDSGFKRSVEDYLRKQANAYEAGAAAIVRQVETFKKKSKHMGHSTADSKVSYSEVVELYDNDTEWYNKAAIYGKKISKESARILKQTEVGALYYYLVRVMRVNVDYVEDFFFKLCNAARNDKSIFNTTMSNLGDKDFIKRSGVKRTDEFISCWNAMVHGCTTQRREYSDWFDHPDFVKKTATLKKSYAVASNALQKEYAVASADLM